MRGEKATSMPRTRMGLTIKESFEQNPGLRLEKRDVIKTETERDGARSGETQLHLRGNVIR